jgi:hypothetical protein
MSDQYDANYFLHGKETGKSLYENYRWMPDLTIPMARAIADHCGILKEDTILDFGCARGYVVRAFRELGYITYGYDVSKWAIENADESVRQHITSSLGVAHILRYDWIIAKDVLEHIKYADMTIRDLICTARKGLFVVVPLSTHDGEPYTIKEYEMDVTHVQRRTLMTWASSFIQPGWSVEVSYRVPGVKDNYAQHTQGNGFITARRVTG